MVFPPRLRLGDSIGIFSPSAPTAGECPRRFARAVAAIENAGFPVVIAKNAQKISGHLAGSISDRVDDLHSLVSDPKVKLIIAAIGGHNTNQLLDAIDFQLIARNPKIYMGYSDATSLLLAINSHADIVTIMGPAVLPQFGEFGGIHPFSWRSLADLVMRPSPVGKLECSGIAIHEFQNWEIDDVKQREIKQSGSPWAARKGSAKGRTAAANLGTLLALMGTRHWPDLKGKILFLEDDETETISSIDRYLTQMSQAGVFSEIAGIVFGRFHPRTHIGHLQLRDLLLRATAQDPIPLIVDFDFGHVDPVVSIPIGTLAALIGDDDQCTVEILEGAVN